MNDQNPFGGAPTVAFGGGATESNMHPLVIVVMAVAVLAILVLPRKRTIGPFLVATFLIPLGQQVVIGGIHWLAPRIVVIAVLLRMASSKLSSKKPLLVGGLNSLDKAFYTCVAAQMVAVLLLTRFQWEAVTNQFGFVIDFLGAYMAARFLIEDEEDIYRALKWLALLTVVLAIGMVREQLTLQNMFGLLGGTRLVPDIREDKIRSQAVFQHSLTAGTFAATLLPLFFILWRNGKSKLLAVTGLVGSTVMTICSNSSTPLLAYAAGLFGITLWPIRRNMKVVRRGLVVTLVCLHLVMKAPVWFLIARIDLTGGSSGYHRAELVNEFINHFREWWLVGTQDAATWGYDLWDAQNQYVSVGETGGLLALWMFIAMIARACARIGISRSMVEHDKRQGFMWLLGAALFANTVAFFGVNYFDQSKVSWFLLLAMIVAATEPILRTREVPLATSPRLAAPPRRPPVVASPAAARVLGPSLGNQVR